VVVFVKAVAGVGRSVYEPSFAKDEDIHPSVVVETKEVAAGGHGLDDVSEAVEFAVNHGFCQAGLVGHIHEAGKRRRGLAHRDRCAEFSGDKRRSES
jgi:hypothetical protein